MFIQSPYVFTLQREFQFNWQHQRLRRPILQIDCIKASARGSFYSEGFSSSTYTTAKEIIILTALGDGKLYFLYHITTAVPHLFDIYEKKAPSSGNNFTMVL